MQKWILVSFFMSFIPLVADPLNGSLELNTSSSDAYEARSTFVNPAALGFQTELNGSALQSSFTYGYSKNTASEFSFGLGYGYFGFGHEHLSSPTQPWNRFSLATGVPITHQWFLGTRYSMTASDDANLSGNHSLDFGLQYRPSKFISLGVQGNRINKSPEQWIGSITVEPIEKLKASFDVDTFSTGFGSNLGYQAFLQYEVLPGLTIGGGYHKTYEFSAGIQFALGRTSVYSNFQPNANSRTWTAGFQTTVLPNKSFLERSSTLKITLDSSLSEEGDPGNFFSAAQPSHLSVLRRIEAATEDSKTKAILLKIENFPLGLAAAEELNRALLAFREKGKTIDVYLGNCSTKEYLIASAGTKILMEPSAELRILGPRSERFYFKGTLDKLGVQGEFLAKGEFKSAPESFTRRDSTAQSREATLAELKALEEGIQNVFSKSRKQVPSWKTLIQTAVFSADDAKAKGLIDEVRNFREAMEDYSRDAHLIEAAVRHQNRLNLASKIAVVVADGDILQKRYRLLSFSGKGQITPEKIAKRIKQAVNDPLTTGIVLRVSSPGGEILASQEIASLVESTKKKMPVIISMGDVAASGGYMISAGATRIFADPLTITGSIGVFLGKVNLEGLYNKIDLKKEIIGSSPYAGLYSESRGWTATERTLMIKRLNDYYSSFVGYVAEKRGLTPDEAERAAKGRVWAAKDALKMKLVDESGGLLEAIKFAATTSHLKEGDYQVELIGDQPGLFGLGDPSSLFMKNSDLVTDALYLLGVKERQDLGWIAMLSEHPYLYWAPSTYLLQ